MEDAETMFIPQFPHRSATCRNSLHSSPQSHYRVVERSHLKLELNNALCVVVHALKGINGVGSFHLGLCSSGDCANASSHAAVAALCTQGLQLSFIDSAVLPLPWKVLPRF